MTADDLLAAGAAATRTALLPRRQGGPAPAWTPWQPKPLALEDDTVPVIAEARASLEQVIRQLTRSQERGQRRARTAIRRLR